MTNSLFICDWGIGGLSIVNELWRRVPQASFTYFSDSGFTPYGKVPTALLAERLVQIARIACDHSAQVLLVACNAASAALPLARGSSAWPDDSLQVIEMIDMGRALIAASPGRRIGVVGGELTIASRLFERPFAESEKVIVPRVAQPLSAFIEAGDLTSPAFFATVREIFLPLADCDSILLACTHYPAARRAIQATVPACQLLDPAALAVDRLFAVMAIEATGKENRPSYLTTGDLESMQKNAKISFGVELEAECWV